MAASIRYCWPVNKSFLNALNCSKISIKPVFKREFRIRNFSSCHASGNGVYSSNQVRNTAIIKVLGMRCASTGVALKPPDVSDGAADSIPKAQVPDGYIIDTPPIPVAEATQEAFSLPELTALGEPTLESMGFATGSWLGMRGHYESLLQYVHVTLDVPWWVAVAVLSVTCRVLLIPVFIWQKKSLANHTNIYPKKMELQMRMEEAKARGNAYETQLYTADYSEYVKNNPYSKMGMYLGPALQGPILLTVYFSLSRMSRFPVECLTTGGYWWFLDMTTPDPYYLLPFIACVSTSLMFELGVDSQKAAEMNFFLKLFFRSLPVLGFFVMCKMPSAMALHMMTNNLFSLIQNQVFGMERVRKLCGIPDAKTDSKGPVDKRNVKAIIKSLQTYRAQRQLEDRKAVASMSFKAAGEGPIPKTYSYNPTKKKLTVS